MKPARVARSAAGDKTRDGCGEEETYTKRYPCVRRGRAGGRGQEKGGRGRTADASDDDGDDHRTGGKLQRVVPHFLHIYLSFRKHPAPSTFPFQAHPHQTLLCPGYPRPLPDALLATAAIACTLCPPLSLLARPRCHHQCMRDQW